MWIYVIQNNLNQKQYVGKTKHTPEKRWRTHLQDMNHFRGRSKLYNALRKYGPENFTVWGMEYTSPSKVDERERYWINVLEPEYNIAAGGTGGLIGKGQLGKRWKVKDTTNMKGKKTVTDKVLQGRKNISGGNNYQSVYYIDTPWGTFETHKDAVEKAKQEKAAGNVHVITNIATLQKYCRSNVLLNKEGRRTPPNWRGRCTKDLGFCYRSKENYD